MRAFVPLLVLSLAGACGAESSMPSPDPGADGPAPGYVRLRTTPITLQPGESGQWIEWVMPPSDRDLDVAQLSGWQSAGGHHAILVSTSDVQPPGTMREWREADQLASQQIGGVGGEGRTEVALPAGVVYRVRAGRALQIQTHYINATDAPIVGESTIDVRFVEASPDAKIASLFLNTAYDVTVPAGETTERTVDCVLKEDIPVLFMANHMHRHGAAIRTTLIGADGDVTLVKEDPVWNYEWAQHPNVVRFDPTAPYVLPAGSTLRTECRWMNESAVEARFPDEMCLFLGLFLGPSDITCVDGRWN